MTINVATAKTNNMLLLNKNSNEIIIKINLDTLLPELKELVENTIKTTIEAQHQIEPSSTQSDLLTRLQTCKLLKISLPTLDARIKDGSIPCFRIGKKVLFDEVKVMESIARKRGKNV
ncbi:AlpA family transcriptional regulator [Pedobacter sp. Hv1]|uniref:helix-turn-helix transcriptional regulator n=1 Tax=Pedobacter sp. Hv1 TaxID=1740090 RepID=UPI00128EE33E|nr:helix-turn-helix domain-containing protein [Pedobacter sp. Hv1]